MEIFSIIAGGALAIMMAYVFFRLAYTIYTNVMNGMKFRQMLEARVREFRLANMLEALGINVRQYVHKEPVVDIEKQMERCGSCENTQTCDEKLTRGDVTIRSIDYCNNEASLAELDDRLKKEEAAESAVR